MEIGRNSESRVRGDYANWDDISRFTYGQRMWRLPDMRARLLAHWMDERHPYRDRFLEYRVLVEEVLSSNLSLMCLGEQPRARSTSLRCIAREIPPVFGSFFS